MNYIVFWQEDCEDHYFHFEDRMEALAYYDKLVKLYPNDTIEIYLKMN